MKNIDIKKTICIIILAALSISVFTACDDKDKYVDVDSLEAVSDIKPLNTQVGEYSYCIKTRSYYDGSSDGTFDDKYLYMYCGLGFNPNNSYDSQIWQMYKLDLQTGALISLCDKPACTHDMNIYPDCINHKVYSFPVMVGNNLWYIKDNCIYEISADGEDRIVFENDFFTEYDKKYVGTSFEKDASSLHHLMLDDNYIYLLGISNFIRVDRSTMKPDMQIHVCDEFLMGQVLYNKDRVYVINMVGENYEIDVEKEEAVKVADLACDLDIYDDRMYFTRRENGIPCLFTSDMSFNNIEKLADGCSAFIVKDGKVFYDHNDSIFCYDTQTGNNRMLVDASEQVLAILSTPYIDRVFVLENVRYEPAEGEDKAALANATISKVISFRTDGSDMWERTIDGKNHSE